MAKKHIMQDSSQEVDDKVFNLPDDTNTELDAIKISIITGDEKISDLEAADVISDAKILALEDANVISDTRILENTNNISNLVSDVSVKKTKDLWDNDSTTILGLGIFGFATDISDFKIGNGIDLWSNLVYNGDVSVETNNTGAITRTNGDVSLYNLIDGTFEYTVNNAASIGYVKVSPVAPVAYPVGMYITISSNTIYLELYNSLTSQQVNLQHTLSFKILD